MPNPEEYDSKKEFLSTCIRELKAEGKKAADARDQCLAMWFDAHPEDE